jgi:hypothetical protein
VPPASINPTQVIATQQLLHEAKAVMDETEAILDIYMKAVVINMDAGVVNMLSICGQYVVNM